MLAAHQLEAVRIDAKYEMLECIGRGAFGRVYRAIQHPIERIVAIKVLDATHAESTRHRRRFRREARALGRIDHPGVLRMFDYGETDGRLHLVTECVNGRSLADVIAAEAPFEPRRAVRLAVLMLDALTAVHRAGFVHRDLKPGNVMVEVDARGREWIRLLDFGVAADLADPRHLVENVGTPRYMAPEQLGGPRFDGRADLFALGAVLYEMLAGRPALPMRTVSTLLNGRRHEPPPPLDPRLELRSDLEALVFATLRLEPEDRPDDAAVLRDALDEILRQLDPEAAPLSLDGGGRTMPPVPLAPATCSDDLAPTADIQRIDPLAATVLHLDVPRSPTHRATSRDAASVSGPWPALDFVRGDGDGAAWRADTRGTGPLPRLLDAELSRRRVAAEASAEPPAHLVATQPLAASVCNEPPCWRRRCFWTLIGINATVLTISASI